jgi:hypothetical protein
MRDLWKHKCYFMSGYMLLLPPPPPLPLLLPLLLPLPLPLLLPLPLPLPLLLLLPLPLQRMLPAERIGGGFSIAFVTQSRLYCRADEAYRTLFYKT